MSKITNDRLNPVWHRMLYSCTRMATVGVKGLRLQSDRSLRVSLLLLLLLLVMMIMLVQLGCVVGLHRVRRRRRTSVSSLHDLRPRGPRSRRRSFQTCLDLRRGSSTPHHRPNHRYLPRPSPGPSDRPVWRHQAGPDQDQATEPAVCRVVGTGWKTGLAWRTGRRRGLHRQWCLAWGTQLLAGNAATQHNWVIIPSQKNNLRLAVGHVIGTPRRWTLFSRDDRMDGWLVGV